MAFPPAFLDELNARNPIEDVVGQYVALTRRGSNLFGLCPFHGEKTPSFSVAPEKGIFYCFGCRMATQIPCSLSLRIKKRCIAPHPLKRQFLIVLRLLP